MKKVLILFLFIANSVKAQDKPLLNPNPNRQWFGMSVWELIFSGGKVNDAGNNLSNVMRFSGVFNYQHQAHYDFNRNIGLYTGFGTRNTGFINKISVPNIGDVTLKQRVYSLGIPLAVKFGNMERGRYLAIGVEPELMLNYKRKILFNDTKSKFSEWVSDEVNLLNTSVFAEIRVHSGSFVRFKYYLDDFLTNKTTSFSLPGATSQVLFTPQKSSLFYISIGTALKTKKKIRARSTEV